MLLPVTFAIEGMPPMLTMKNLLGFAWLGIVGTGIAYALWFRGIRTLKASTVAFLGLLSPIAAMLLDFLLLKKTLTTMQIVGAALVFGGIVISQVEQRRDGLGTMSEYV
jgi:probable blue pigment (indigoidine) exporter